MQRLFVKGCFVATLVLVATIEPALANCNPFGCSHSSAADCNPFGCPNAPSGEACTPFGCPSSSAPQTPSPTFDPTSDTGGSPQAIQKCMDGLLYRTEVQKPFSGWICVQNDVNCRTVKVRTEMSEYAAARACQNAR